MAENLVKMPPKTLNRYPINAVIKYYEYMLQGCHFNLTFVSKNSILTILKATQVSKGAGLDNLSRCFLKDGAKCLAKLISDLCNLSINSEKFPDLCKVAKLKPLYKKDSLTQSCNYIPISLLLLISKVIGQFIHDQTSSFLNSKKLLYTDQSIFRKENSKKCFLFYRKCSFCSLLHLIL